MTTRADRGAVEASVREFVGASVRFRTVPGSSIPIETRMLLEQLLAKSSFSQNAIVTKGFYVRSERI